MENLRYALITVVAMLILVLATFFVIITNQSAEQFSLPELVRKISFKGAASIDAVAFNSQKGLIFAADKENGVVYAADLSGRLKSVIKHRDYGEDGFLGVFDLTSYENGVLVSDPLQRQIFFYNLKDRPVEFVCGKVPIDFRPGCIYSPDSQIIYASDSEKPAVYKIDQSGRILEKFFFSSKNVSMHATGVYSQKNVLMLAESSFPSFYVLSSKERKKISLKGRTGTYTPFGLVQYRNYLLTCDPFYSEVIVFSFDGKEKGAFGASKNPERALKIPVDIDLKGSYIFVAEKGGKCVSIWKIK